MVLRLSSAGAPGLLAGAAPAGVAAVPDGGLVCRSSAAAIGGASSPALRPQPASPSAATSAPRTANRARLAESTRLDLARAYLGEWITRDLLIARSIADR